MSTVFQVVARFRADTRQFSSRMSQATATLRTFESEAQRVASRAQRAGVALTRAVTTPMALIGAAAIGASISFESAFTGIRKTVDATEQQFGQLEDRIREMSLTIPQSANELARIGEIAGQLGIEAEGLDKFIRTVADLDVATTMDQEEAAFALSRISQVMGNSVDESQNLASTIVDLGNNFATTESEITHMAMRITGAANAVGVTTDEVLALSAAMSSVGIRSQMGGSAISRVMIQIAGAVETGGDLLHRFAEVAGTSAGTFAEQFEERPIEAIMAFVEGLGSMNDAGLDVFGTLKDLQLSEIRVRDTLLRLAGAGEHVRDAVSLGNEAWRENTALTEEANRRYETTESQLRMLWNRVVEAARGLGDALVPAFLDVAKAIVPVIEGTFGLIRKFGELPPAIRGAITGFGALIMAAGPLSFAFGKAVEVVDIIKTRAFTAGTALLTVGTWVERFALKMRISLATAFGIVGVAVAGLVTGLGFLINHLANMSSEADSSADAARNLAESTGRSMREIEDWSKNVDDATDSLMAFQQTNADTVQRLRGMDFDTQRQFLIEIGTQLVKSGAGSPEEILGEIERLADAADIRVDLKIETDDLDDLEQVLGGSAQRIADLLESKGGLGFFGGVFNPAINDVKKELTGVAEMLLQTFQNGDTEEMVRGWREWETAIEDSTLNASQQRDMVNFLADEFLKLGEFMNVSTTNAHDLDDVMRELFDSGNLNQEMVMGLEHALGRVSDREYYEFLTRQQKGHESAGQAAIDHAEDVEEVENAYEEATEAVNSHLEKLQAVADPMFAVFQAQQNLEEASANLEAVREDEESTTRDLLNAEFELADALMEMHGAHARANAVMEEGSDRAGTLDRIFGELAEKYGINKSELKELVEEFGSLEEAILQIPTDLDTTIRADADDFIETLNEIDERIKNDVAMRAIFSGQEWNVDINANINPVTRQSSPRDTSGNMRTSSTRSSGTSGGGSVTRHAGGLAGLSGPRIFRNLKADEFPTVLQRGEFVLSRRMVARLRSMSSAVDSMQRMHQGGEVGRPSPFSSASDILRDASESGGRQRLPDVNITVQGDMDRPTARRTIHELRKTVMLMEPFDGG